MSFTPLCSQYRSNSRRLMSMAAKAASVAILRISRWSLRWYTSRAWRASLVFRRFLSFSTRMLCRSLAMLRGVGTGCGAGVGAGFSFMSGVLSGGLRPRHAHLRGTAPAFARRCRSPSCTPTLSLCRCYDGQSRRCWGREASACAMSREAEHPLQAQTDQWNAQSVCISIRLVPIRRTASLGAPSKVRSCEHTTHNSPYSGRKRSFVGRRASIDAHAEAQPNCQGQSRVTLPPADFRRHP